MGYDKQVSQENQTEFNASIATLKRIDQIKRILDGANLMGDQDKRFKALKTLFFELISIFKEADDIKQQARFKEVRAIYNAWGMKTNRGLTPANVVDTLDDWEIELKNLEQSYGLNMPKKKDPRYAMA